MRILGKAGFILSLLVLAPFSAAAEQTTPNLWKLEDKDTTIYIFGTIHLMREDVDWYTPGLDRAMNEADRLYLELSPKETANPYVIQSLVVRHGLLTDGRTLEGVVGSSDYQKMVNVLEEMDMAPLGFNVMKPWLAATALSVQISAASGYLPEYGVETILTKKAKEKRIKVKGLEKASFQIGIFSGMTEETQKAFFHAAVESVDSFDENFEILKNAWLAGDTETLARNLSADFEAYPEAAEALLYSRNRDWAEKVGKLMRKKGTFVVAVGTGHLVGKENLIELLEDKGYEVTLQR